MIWMQMSDPEREFNEGNISSWVARILWDWTINRFILHTEKFQNI